MMKLLGAVMILLSAGEKQCYYRNSQSYNEQCQF